MVSYYWDVVCKAGRNTWGSLKRRAFGILSGTSFIIGLLVYGYWQGWEAAINELIVWAAFGVIPSMLIVLLLLIGNLLRAPYQLHLIQQQEIGELQHRLTELGNQLQERQQSTNRKRDFEEERKRWIEAIRTNPKHQFSLLSRQEKRIVHSCLLHNGFKVIEALPHVPGIKLMHPTIPPPVHESALQLHINGWLECQRASGFKPNRRWFYNITPQIKEIVENLFREMPDSELNKLRRTSQKKYDFDYSKHVP